MVFILSLICVLIGDLNMVSTLLSNFFIAAYALINFVGVLAVLEFFQKRSTSRDEKEARRVRDS